MNPGGVGGFFGVNPITLKSSAISFLTVKHFTGISISLICSI